MFTLIWLLSGLIPILYTQWRKQDNKGPWDFKFDVILIWAAWLLIGIVLIVVNMFV